MAPLLSSTKQTVAAREMEVSIEANRWSAFL